MKRYCRVTGLVPLFMSMLIVIFPVLAHAGYVVVDRDGKVISETPEKVLEVSSSEKRVVFLDGGSRKVFDVEWDASKRTLIVKGDNVYLRIYSTGQIEKMTTINEGEKQQMPIFVEPVVPVMPKQNPPRK